MLKDSTRLRPVDAQFHQPAYRDPTWLETNWFSFLVPERNLRGHVYAVFRVNLGVVASRVVIWSGDCPRGIVDADYSDVRNHLPIPPQNLDNYSLANGLSVRMVEPLQKYEITYRGFEDMSLELVATGLMPAVESRDTKLPDGEEFSHFHLVESHQKDSIGHLDQTMRMVGVLRLRGEEIEIDYPSNRDHSWSPRPELKHGWGNFDEGCFGDELLFHVQTRAADSLEEGNVTNGYVVRDGEVRGLRSGRGSYRMDGWITRTLRYELEDETGETYVIEGEPTNMIQQASSFFPNQYGVHGLTRWSWNGRVGWGEYKWHAEVSEMQSRRAVTKGSAR
ncbi:MAG TPA: hypothetical protein VHW74_10725 [Mycobacteriales bacterium]|nr:hypothetical protein [Mycobacteriales bacterium]